MGDAAFYNPCCLPLVQECGDPSTVIGGSQSMKRLYTAPTLREERLSVQR